MRGAWDRPPMGDPNPAEIAGLIVVVFGWLILGIVVVGVGFTLGWPVAVALCIGMAAGFGVAVAGR
jgi:hypothetical protein